MQTRPPTFTPRASAAQRPPQTVDDSDIYDTRMPTSSRRYNTGQNTQTYTRGNQQIIVHRGPPPRRNRGQVSMLIGAIVALLLLWLGNVAWNNYQLWQLNQQYESPHISQADQAVGHNDSADHQSHFIVMNLHGHISIIEYPGGDVSKARAYDGPTLIGDNGNAVATISFVEDNGRQDMILNVAGQNITYINDGNVFKEQQQ